MKKRYEKPMVLFEDFSMNTNIAGNCTIIEDNQSENICNSDYDGLLMPGVGYIFTQAVCMVPHNPDDDWDGICYHIPNDSSKLFNS